jgi:hypothetical protein
LLDDCGAPRVDQHKPAVNTPPILNAQCTRFKLEGNKKNFSAVFPRRFLVTADRPEFVALAFTRVFAQI